MRAYEGRRRSGARRSREIREGQSTRWDTVLIGAAANVGRGAAIGQTGVMRNRDFSTGEAREIGERIGIDWDRSRFDVEQFRMGLGVELEHGSRDPETNVSDDDKMTTGKIARAHLNEFPDYYTRLAKMEAEAEQYWSEQER